MVEDIIYVIFVRVFKQCAIWVDQLLDAVGGSGIVMAAFLIVLVISLLFIPMRGNAATNIKAYSEKKIYSNKKANAKKANSNKNKDGG